MSAHQTSSDNALMQGIAAGDEQAFAELYQRYGRQMFRFFYRMLWQDAGRAEDFTQELFIKIIERPRAFDPTRSFPLWLYTLASNLCKNEYRRQARAPVAFTTVFVERPEAARTAQADQDLLERQLRAAIDALPEAQRRCFILRYQEELSVQAIAHICACPEGTVKSRLHQALQKISAAIQLVWDTDMPEDLYKSLNIKYL